MKSYAQFSWQTLLLETQGHLAASEQAFKEAPLETDTRTMEAGSFFLPIVGGNFDGNAYIEKAYEKGAIGAFVSASYLESHPELLKFSNLISVEDPLLAYHALARYHRRHSQAKIIAITGSCGKTTTKEMLFAMLSQALGKSVQKSEKNFNNEIGVPMTLLNLKSETQVLVLEMGMRGLGQIKLLSHCAEPDIAIITNIGSAHIGLLGSVEAICQAKCEIFSGLDPQTGLGIINGDDSLLTAKAPGYWPHHLETFSLTEAQPLSKTSSDVTQFEYEGVPFLLGLPGHHNVLNALAAIKACEALGIDLNKLSTALENFEAGGERWQQIQIEGAKQLYVINDSYNANPQSMKVALQAFLEADFPGLQKVAVLGGMAELGEFSAQYHQEVGEWLNTQTGLDGLVVLGEEALPLFQALKFPAYYVVNSQAAAEMLQTHWPQGAIFFLKASRAFHLEVIPELLSQKPSSVLQ